MKRWRQILKALLYPPGISVALLIPLSGAALAAVFMRDLGETAFAYAVYTVSAYTAVAAALRLVLLWKMGKALLHKNAFFHRYMTDPAFKAEASLYISFGVTLFYCVYKAAAGYAFYNLTMAVRGLIRYRKLPNPVYSASKALALAAAFVSMFFLQTSMFAAFGDGGARQRYLNMGTGGCVFLLIAAMALFMIRRGDRSIQALSAQ